MPVQPLKAMATIVITQKISPSFFMGWISNWHFHVYTKHYKTIDWISQIVPKTVIVGFSWDWELSLAC
ncbi:MAG: hypothetical protein Ct9H300mP2_4010 [Candidatus Neomarinimicrobiota bacterium]|nr:MAG: hypothetical protein Ct9H300mP2_4010 [Candidatus Neomarinimicrobiota bacterium]